MSKSSHVVTALLSATIALPAAGLAAGPKSPLSTAVTKSKVKVPPVAGIKPPLKVAPEVIAAIKAPLTEVQLIDKVKVAGITIDENAGMDEVLKLSSTQMRDGHAYLSVACSNWITGHTAHSDIWFTPGFCTPFVDVVFAAQKGRVYAVECAVSEIAATGERIDANQQAIGYVKDLGKTSNAAYVVAADADGNTGVRFTFTLPPNGGMRMGSCQVARVAI
jgi:hypothetical protein